MMFCEQVPYRNGTGQDVHPVFRGKLHVHLMGDDEYELRMFAGRIGMKARWLQRDKRGIPHFDCVEGKFMAEVLASEFVVKLARADFVREYRKLKDRTDSVAATA